MTLFINDAKHKAHIEVSEEGVKAAAVTVIFFDKATAADPEIKFVHLSINI